MKNKIIYTVCILLAVLSGYAKDEPKTATILVSGSCDMCKTNIEEVLKKKDGIISKDWNLETKTLTVTYEPSKITLVQIGEKIAAAGYDNEYARARDEKYNKLPHCCHYERKTK